MIFHLLKGAMSYGLVLLVGLAVVVGCGSGSTDSTSSSDSSPNSPPPSPPSPPGARVYTTNFPLVEDPISEGGNWINGKTVGLDWSDFQSTTNLAYGKQTGVSLTVYDDSIALLAGTWGVNQTVQATIKTVGQTDAFTEELEIRLRSTIMPHSSTGYEILYTARCSINGYLQVVKWNGPIGDFTILGGDSGTTVCLHNGDTIKASIIGNVITAYINGVQKFQITDNTFTSGSPGIGQFLDSATGVNSDYGFTSVTASD